MPDPQPLMNEPAARTPTGEIKPQDSTTTQPPTESTTNTNPETKAPEAKTPEASSTEPKPKEGDTLLTKKDDEAPKAPEKYEAFKLPEGITLEGETLTKAHDLFKGLNLSQEAAQSLVDFHAAQMKAIADGPVAEYDAMRSDWKTKSEADPDIGPMDGSKAKAIRVTIGRALAALDNPTLANDFKSAMNLTGVGDHPAFIKAFAKFAEKFVEGRPVNLSGANPSPSGQKSPDAKPPTIASAMYPNLPA